jgi:hypothetical protein
VLLSIDPDSDCMQLVSVLAGTSLITQATDFARGLKAEWRRLCVWVETRLEAFVEPRRSIETQFMPLSLLKAVNDRLGRLLDRALDTTEVEQAVQRSEPMPERMTEEREWALAIREFHLSAGSAERAVRLQETAALQIDAAAYALDGLFDDLRGIMSVQGRDNVFAHQADYTEQYADTLYAAAVKAAVKEVVAPRHSVGHRRAA